MNLSRNYWNKLATRNSVIDKKEQREIQETLEKQHWLVKLFMRSMLWRSDDSVLIYHFGRDLDGNNISTAKKHSKELLCYLGLLIGFVICLVSLVADFQNSEFFWFQRSGAVLVFFSLIAAYVGDEHTNTTNERLNFDLESYRYRLIRKISKILGRVLAVVGTLVWAYGDLPFRQCVLS